MLKVCSKCGVEKDVETEFPLVRRWCKKCLTEYRRTRENSDSRIEYKLSYKGYYKQIKSKAKIRGITFFITMNDLEQMEQKSGECAYCLRTLESQLSLLRCLDRYNGDNYEVKKIKKTLSSLSRQRKFSVDRTNSLGGYTVDNCVTCCGICNFVKGWAIPADQYKLIAPAVIANIVKICTDAGLVI